MRDNLASPATCAIVSSIPPRLAPFSRPLSAWGSINKPDFAVWQSIWIDRMGSSVMSVSAEPKSSTSHHKCTRPCARGEVTPTPY
ncbi:hypothetical protein BJV77DRAFT_259328 [Russula vinacea]|nr:hypothetical protein BJV77DRAFT_259328 [Russula vinacea]